MWELLVRKEIYSRLTSIFFRNLIIKWITQLKRPVIYIHWIIIQLNKTTIQTRRVGLGGLDYP